MRAATCLALSIYLCKKADEVTTDKPKSVDVKTWDVIKGAPAIVNNTNFSDIENPNSENMPTDLYVNNKQLITGTGSGARLYGRYRNGQS